MFYWNYVEDIVTPQDTDHSEYSSIKRFWTFIKHQKSDFSNIAPLKVAGRLITDTKMKAETLNHQFQSVFTRETDFQRYPAHNMSSDLAIYQHHSAWCGETAEKPETWESSWSILTTLARECWNLPKPLLILSPELFANLSLRVVCLRIGNTPMSRLSLRKDKSMILLIIVTSA